MTNSRQRGDAVRGRSAYLREREITEKREELCGGGVKEM